MLKKLPMLLLVIYLWHTFQKKIANLQLLHAIQINPSLAFAVGLSLHCALLPQTLFLTSDS